jgi:flavin-dependent dehydrogenase
VVGGGPAGAYLAYRIARDGGRVTLFDASHPREKPCGGGLTPRALELLPEAPPSDPLPGRWHTTCRFDSGEGPVVDVSLPRAMLVAPRLQLDAWLLRRAVEAGAEHVAERVVEVSPGRLRTARGARTGFDVVVGADGAGSLVRRTFLAPVPPARLVMATGWIAPGDAPLLVRFLPGLAGYLWLFPRPGHVDVGACAPLGGPPTAALRDRLEAEAARHFPALAEPAGSRYAHTIPSLSADPRSVLEVAGPGWALVGDAAGLADPITGEGIFGALQSASFLADTLRSGSPAAYPRRLLEGFGGDFVRAAALRPRFYAAGFPTRMVSFSRRSPAIRAVLRDLVLGEQPYRTLKRRLLRSGPRFLAEALRSLLPDRRRGQA